MHRGRRPGLPLGELYSLEYGDPFSIMGASTRQQHNWHRAQIGWLSDIQTATTTGTYTVAPIEFAVAPRLLRVARGDGKYFYLEFASRGAPTTPSARPTRR